MLHFKDAYFMVYVYILSGKLYSKTQVIKSQC